MAQDFLIDYHCHVYNSNDTNMRLQNIKFHSIVVIKIQDNKHQITIVIIELDEHKLRYHATQLKDENVKDQ